MCGIAGIVSYTEPVDKNLLHRMCAIIAHRGPDDMGVFVENTPIVSVGLGAQRLSIIDLSPAGHMPMHNESGDITIVYNGEIYNHQDLRSEMERKGHTYRSRTDTETILHAYEEYGIDCLRRFNGMFAFAIYDRRKGHLLLARDRLGVKPLYYYWDGNSLIFASELKTLLVCPRVERRIDPNALDYYLTLSYVPSPYSMLKGVRKLPPGNYMLLDIADKNLRIESYWSPNLGQGCHGKTNDAELVHLTREIVSNAVSRQLMSDVPVGVLLSGGVDSTIVAAVAQETREDPIDTFSMGYTGRLVNSSDKTCNQDAEYACLVSRRIGSRHHETRISDTELAGLLPRVVNALDEPLSESTSIAQYILARLARQHGVVVLLTGDGSDELFAGYSWYQYAYLLEKLGRVPALPQLAAVLGRLLHNTRIGRRAERVRIRVSGQQVERYRSLYQDFGTFSEEEKRILMLPGTRQEIVCDPIADVVGPILGQAKQMDLAGHLSWADLRLWVAEHFNQRLDRMSMLASVEARVPFQDNEVVDFALALPMPRRMPRGERKFLLRRAFADILPPEVLRRPKRPFVGPYESWLFGPLREFTLETLSADRVGRWGLLDPDFVQRMTADFYAKRSCHPAKVWTLFIFQLWCDTYLAETAQLRTAEELCA